MRKTDFLIVGQGIAGTLLTHFLLEAGQKILVIDNHHKTASTKVAAGIINPVTGRRIVKSWKIDELLPFAEKTYQEIEKKLDISIFHKRNIVRAIFSAKENHDWQIRTMEPGYQKYLIGRAMVSDFENKIQPAFSFGEIKNSAQLDLPILINTYRNYLVERDLLISEEVDYQQFKIEKALINYKNIQAKKVIFCEGQAAVNNPFFNYLPFNLAKGEVLILKILNANFQKLIKHKNFLAPLGNNQYWFGSNYDWDFNNDLPTKEGKEKLLMNLQKSLNTSFEIEKHLAAIRPTVKDRRPFLGHHPKFHNFLIFNGLGTKGASLGAFFANYFVKHLLQKQELSKEVNINRFD